MKRIISIFLLLLVTSASASDDMYLGDKTFRIDGSGSIRGSSATSDGSVAKIPSVPDIILGFYNFESTTTGDVSEYGFDGVEIGTPTLSAGWLSLNGTTDAIDLTSHLFQWSGQDAFSFSAKVKTSAGSGTHAIVNFSDRGTTATHCLMFLNSSGYPVFQIAISGVYKFRWEYQVNIRDGAEHHIIASMGPSGSKFWVDNTLVTNLIAGSSSDPTSLSGVKLTNSSIGCNVYSSGNRYFFSGLLDDIVFLNRELTNADADMMYANGRYAMATVMLAGQSNMIGYPDIRPGIDDDYTTIAGKVFQFGFYTQTVTPATNPLHHPDETAGRMGLWLEFANAYIADLPYGWGILLVPVAEGGTGFVDNEWNRGDPAYSSAVARMNSALAAFSMTKTTGVFWHQGEKDAQNGGVNYYKNISAMHSGFKNDINGFGDNTPFVSAALISTCPLLGSAINADQERFANSIQAGGFYNSTELAGVDFLHYSAASLATMGENYYRLFKAAQNQINFGNVLKIDPYGTTIVGKFLQQGIYGGVHFHDASAPQTIPVGLTYTKITPYTDNSFSSNVTPNAANDKTTITVKGRYRVEGSLSFASGVDKIDWWGAPFLDGVEQDQIHFNEAAVKDILLSPSFTGFINVPTVPVDIDFRVRHSHTADVDMSPTYGNINVQYIGEIP